MVSSVATSTSPIFPPPPSVKEVKRSVSASTSGNKYKKSNSARNALSFHVDPTVGNKAVRYAIRVHEEMSKRSTLLNQHKHQSNHSNHHTSHEASVETAIAPFERDEIIPYIGELLGKGGFNSVYEIDKVHINMNHIENEIMSDVEKEKKMYIQHNVSKMAIKFLSSDAYNTTEDACNGSADLYMEAQYLSALTQHPQYHHPNIIQIHGVAACGPQGLAIHGGYFIIIDRLYDTLDRRIDIWKELQRRKVMNLTSSATTPTNITADSHTSTNEEKASEVKKYLKVLLVQRVLVAYEIISALHHLHTHNIIFRDLKPDNIGFDVHNKVKIFDFGLAKELDPKQLVPNHHHKQQQLYVMSGGTGSRRFMAPEVSLSQPYGLSADLYSFSIVAWEILALEKAYGRLSVEEHHERVVQGTDRPTIPHDWTIGIKEILTGCWDRETSYRPCSGTVQRLLQKEISNMMVHDFPAQAATIKAKEAHK